MATLGKILTKSFPDIKFTNFIPVQHIKDSSYFIKNIKNIQEADAIILQNINQTQKDPFIHILQKNKKAFFVFIDSLYASFEHPELIKLDISTFKIGKLHDKEVLRAIVKGWDFNFFLKNDPFYNAEYFSCNIYKDLMLKTLTEIQDRQKNLFNKISHHSLENFFHIDITKFITQLETNKSYTQMLWNDLNHPSSPVFEYLTTNIASALNLGNSMHCSLYPGDKLMPIYRPPYKSTTSYYKFKDQDEAYTLGNEYIAIDRKKYVIDCFNFYKNLPEYQLNKIQSIFKN